MDHALLLERLCSIGLSDQAVGWFKNYLSDRSQCVRAEGITSSSLNVSKGVPQGSVLGPLLFTSIVWIVKPQTQIFTFMPMTL